MSFAFVGTTREITSAITGQRLLVNDSPDKFLVLSHADYTHYDALFCSMTEWLNQPTKKYEVFPVVRDAMGEFKNVTGPEDLAVAIDALLSVVVGNAEKSLGQKMKPIAWLLRLWVEGFLCFPDMLPFKTKTAYFLDEFSLGVIYDWVYGLKTASLRSNANSIPGALLRIISRVSGIVEPGDVCPGCYSKTVALRNDLKLVVTPLLALQRSLYGDLACYTTKDWGIGKVSRVNDRQFSWAIQKAPELEDWRKNLADWLTKGRNLANRTHMANRLLAYLIAHPSLPRSIQQYCRRGESLTPTWGEWTEQQGWSDASKASYGNALVEFLDWYLLTHLTFEDDAGSPVRSKEHFNPIFRVAVLAGKSETHRDALPLRYIRELINILTEDDFAWSKSLRSEYFMWHDPETGQFVRTWSPVRTYAMLIKLHLPLRTYQVRMLDSGEVDAEIFQDGRWQKNVGPLSGFAKHGTSRGFLRKFHDNIKGKVFTGFYINTNKTADQFKWQDNRGYEIPWQQEDVIRLAVELRAWQQRFNPIERPTEWESMHDRTVTVANTKEQLRLRGAACFLFRDPRGAFRNEPILDSRLKILWSMLLRELERRLASRETLPDGSPIKFVQPYEGTGLPRPIFDLHSLRVSLITAYAIDGGVPIEILSKCVAGHASVVMTLYYTKPGAAYISNVLAEAEEAIFLKEQENFASFLQNTEAEAAIPFVAINDEASIDALSHVPKAGWVVGDAGVCPVGMSKCDIGGSRQGESQPAKYGPVPGGAKNCPRCRFFVTGPAFLGGLVARFNSTGVMLLEAAKRLRQIENDILLLENDASIGTPRIKTVYAHRDRVLEEVDRLAHDWHAVYALVTKSKRVLVESTAAGSGVDLVLSGALDDFELSMRECGDFELYDAVCQSAHVYPSEASTVANLRRGRLLDALLASSEIPSVFVGLSEEEMLSVGNAFTQFLAIRIGKPALSKMIEGTAIIDHSGLRDAVAEVTQTTLTPKRIAGPAAASKTPHIQTKLEAS